MTENEAIERIKDLSDRGYPMLREAKEMAISALKEIQKYREIGTVEECREAMEKQKAKKIQVGVQNFYKCPMCQSILRITDKYCHECGQAINSLEETEE